VVAVLAAPRWGGAEAAWRWRRRSGAAAGDTLWPRGAACCGAEVGGAATIGALRIAPDIAGIEREAGAIGGAAASAGPEPSAAICRRR
jgi:hypothetical protein